MLRAVNSQPYTIHVPDRVLDDLRERLARTRWPDTVDGAGWDYGANLDYVRGLAEYWRTGFDWHAQEARLNSLPNYQAEVGGLGIHFIHVRGNGPHPLPIVLTHGWPSTFLEELAMLPLLSDPAAHGGDAADAFDVVIPSLPGYGFSDRPSEKGMSAKRTAALWSELMQGLGYPRFVAHGGDWGAAVTTQLGLGHSNHVAAIHLTSATIVGPHLGEGSAPLSAAEQALVKHRDWWQATEHGYSHEQRTKPLTLAYGLSDSPVGMLAWIVEKFWKWSDNEGDVEERFTRDDLLTNATIYWATQTISSSVRFYKESAEDPVRLGPGERVEAPTGFAIFPGDSSQPPREWAERSYNVQRYTLMPSGGHFGAWEEPELLANELREFFRPLRG